MANLQDIQSQDEKGGGARKRLYSTTVNIGHTFINSISTSISGPRRLPKNTLFQHGAVCNDSTTKKPQRVTKKVPDSRSGLECKAVASNETRRYAKKQRRECESIHIVSTGLLENKDDTFTPKYRIQPFQDRAVTDITRQQQGREFESLSSPKPSTTTIPVETTKQLDVEQQAYLHNTQTECRDINELQATSSADGNDSMVEVPTPEDSDSIFDTTAVQTTSSTATSASNTPDAKTKDLQAATQSVELTKLKKYPVPEQISIAWNSALKSVVEIFTSLSRRQRCSESTLQIKHVEFIGLTLETARPVVRILGSNQEELKLLKAAFEMYRLPQSLAKLVIAYPKTTQGKQHKSKFKFRKTSGVDIGQSLNDSGTQADTETKSQDLDTPVLAAGAIIHAFLDNRYLCSVTVGGFILLDGIPFGVTVGHLFESVQPCDNAEKSHNNTFSPSTELGESSSSTFSTCYISDDSEEEGFDSDGPIEWEFMDLESQREPSISGDFNLLNREDDNMEWMESEYQVSQSGNEGGSGDASAYMIPNEFISIEREMGFVDVSHCGHDEILVRCQSSGGITEFPDDNSRPTIENEPIQHRGKAIQFRLQKTADSVLVGNLYYSPHLINAPTASNLPVTIDSDWALILPVNGIKIHAEDYSLPDGLAWQEEWKRASSSLVVPVEEDIPVERMAFAKRKGGRIESGEKVCLMTSLFPDMIKLPGTTMFQQCWTADTTSSLGRGASGLWMANNLGFCGQITGEITYARTAIYLPASTLFDRMHQAFPEAPIHMFSNFTTTENSLDKERLEIATRLLKTRRSVLSRENGLILNEAIRGQIARGHHGCWNDTLSVLPGTCASDDWTPLHFAACNNHTLVLQTLLDNENGKTGSVNVKDASNHTPFYYAVLNGHIASLDLLYGAGADINSLNGNFKCSALETAIYLDQTKSITWLLEHGADVSMRAYRLLFRYPDLFVNNLINSADTHLASTHRAIIHIARRELSGSDSAIPTAPLLKSTGSVAFRRLQVSEFLQGIVDSGQLPGWKSTKDIVETNLYRNSNMPEGPPVGGETINKTSQRLGPPPLRLGKYRTEKCTFCRISHKRCTYKGFPASTKLHSGQECDACQKSTKKRGPCNGPKTFQEDHNFSMLKLEAAMNYRMSIAENSPTNESLPFGSASVEQFPVPHFSVPINQFSIPIGQFRSMGEIMDGSIGGFLWDDSGEPNTHPFLENAASGSFSTSSHSVRKHIQPSSNIYQFYLDQIPNAKLPMTRKLFSWCLAGKRSFSKEELSEVLIIATQFEGSGDPSLTCEWTKAEWDLLANLLQPDEQGDIKFIDDAARDCIENADSQYKISLPQAHGIVAITTIAYLRKGDIQNDCQDYSTPSPWRQSISQYMVLNLDSHCKGAQGGPLEDDVYRSLQEFCSDHDAFQRWRLENSRELLKINDI